MVEDNRALQIRIAQLQADIRIASSGVLGSAALTLTVLLPVYQIGMESWENLSITIPKLTVFIILLIVSFFFAYATYRFYNELRTTRNELGSLR